MPAAVQSLVEKKIQTQGTLGVMMEDGKSGARLQHYVKTGPRRLDLKFAAHAPTDLLTGAMVKVQGVQVGNKRCIVRTGVGHLESPSVLNAEENSCSKFARVK